MAPAARLISKAMRSCLALSVLGGLLAACGSGAASLPPAAAQSRSFLDQFHHVSQLASTVPANGDVNPYGVAVVPESLGDLVAGDALVTNFNDRQNVQGTGTTVVEVSRQGQSRLFAQLSQLPTGESCAGGVGLTVALGVLPGGWVIVGSLPTIDEGNLPRRDPAGCLLVLDDQGHPVETITNHDLDGPWDLTMRSTSTSATVFVSDALGTQADRVVDGDLGAMAGATAGEADIVRLTLALRADAPPKLVNTTIVGKGFAWSAEKAALVLAPTGLTLDGHGTLYVDDTARNVVCAIPDALTRSRAIAANTAIISSSGALNQPLGMTTTPTGDLLVVNGNDGNAVEISPSGKQLASHTIVPHGAGALIGLTLDPASHDILFVNDATNALDVLSG